MLRTSAGLGSLLVGQASQKSVPLPSKNIFFKKYGEYSIDTGMQQMIIVKNTNRVSTILCSTSVKDPRPVKRGQIGLSLSYDTAGIYIYIFPDFGPPGATQETKKHTSLTYTQQHLWLLFRFGTGDTLSGGAGVHMIRPRNTMWTFYLEAAVSGD